MSEPKLNVGSMSNQIELLQKAIAEEKMEGKKQRYLIYVFIIVVVNIMLLL
jgi:hypothetical protein